MADKIYDDDPHNDEVGSLKTHDDSGVESSSSSASGSNSGAGGNYGLSFGSSSNSKVGSTVHKNTGVDSSDGSASSSNSGVGGNTTTTDDSTSADTSAATGSKANRGEEKKSFYRKTKTAGAKISGGKKKWLLIAGGGGGILIAAMVIFILISSLLIPNLAQNILTYQFARVARSFSQDNLEITSEKVALDSVATKADETAVDSELSDASTGGLLTKFRNYTPGGVIKNLQSDGTLSYNYEPSSILKRNVLKSITVDGQTFDVNPSGIRGNFQKLIHPIQTFQDQVTASKGLSDGLQNSMRDEVGIVIRGKVEYEIRQELGVGLTAWVVSKFKGDTPSEASNEMDKDAEAEIQPPSDTGIPSNDSTVEDAKAAATMQEQADAGTAAGLAKIRADNGEDVAASDAADTVIAKSVNTGILGKVSPVYAIAVPVCIIYDGSLSSPSASQTINTQDSELQRSFYLVESAADQQKAGDTNAEAVGAMNTKLGNIAQSNAEIRASGGVVDTGSKVISPQAGAGGQYSIANALLPAPLGTIANDMLKSWGPFPPVCSFITNPYVGLGLVVGQIIASVAGAVTTGGAADAAGAGGAAGLELTVDAGTEAVGTAVADEVTSSISSQVFKETVGKFAELFSKSNLKNITAVTGLTVLAKMDTLAKMGETYNGYSQGTTFANQADAGGNLNANEVEQKEFYGAPLSADQIAYNDNADKQFIADQNKSQDAFQRYLSTTNANSLVSRLAINIDSNLNRSFFSNIVSDITKYLNPLNIGSTMANLFGHSKKAAAAAATIDDTNDYGIVQWGYTGQEQQLMTNDPSYQPLENAKILNLPQNINEVNTISTTYGPCFTDDMGTLITQGLITRDNNGNITGGMCSQSYLGPNSVDQNAIDHANPSDYGDSTPYGNDLIFRWRLEQSYNNTLDQLTGIQSANTQ